MAGGAAGVAQQHHNTRARCSLREVPIEELERALLEDWVEDGEAAAAAAGELTEYEKFLRVRAAAYAICTCGGVLRGP